MAGGKRRSADAVRAQLVELIDIAVAVLEATRGRGARERKDLLAECRILRGELLGDTESPQWRALVLANERRNALALNAVHTTGGTAGPAHASLDPDTYAASMLEARLHGARMLNRVASLEMMAQDFLVYWNESSGAHVDAFWKEVASRDLPFERKDPIGDALARGMIRGHSEYEAAVDGIVVRQQLGTLLGDDAKRLGEMIGDYEVGRRRKR